MKLFLEKQHLQEIKENADWKGIFNALGLKRHVGKSKNNDYWALSPFTQENTPSFHVNAHGFKDFSSGKGGDILQLVKEIMGFNDTYRAGRWLIENGLSRVRASTDKVEKKPTPPPVTEESLEKKKKSILVNPPIRQNLIPNLATTHQEFSKRGISPETCNYLGCGYLPTDKIKANHQMAGKVVFQVRGVQTSKDQQFKPVILTHMARSFDKQDLALGQKWRAYQGFVKRIELFNLDKVLLDQEAIAQTRVSGTIILVEGCFDVAKLVEAGIKNVVSCFGAYLYDEQLERIRLISEKLEAKRVILFFDRDEAGQKGAIQGKEKLEGFGLEANLFDWNQKFSSQQRQGVPIPEFINDPCEFKVNELVWLREQHLI